MHRDPACYVTVLSNVKLEAGQGSSEHMHAELQGVSAFHEASVCLAHTSSSYSLTHSLPAAQQLGTLQQQHSSRRFHNHSMVFTTFCLCL